MHITLARAYHAVVANNRKTKSHTNNTLYTKPNNDRSQKTDQTIVGQVIPYTILAVNYTIIAFIRNAQEHHELHAIQNQSKTRKL